MWIVLTALGVFVGGGLALGGTLLIRNRRRRIKARRKVRVTLGKAAVAGVNKQRVRNRRKAANRAGWKAGLRTAAPWFFAGLKAGGAAFRDAKGDVLHPNQRIRTAGHAKSDKPGPWTKTTPKPGQPQGQGQPRQLERHSVTLLGGKPGSGQGQGGGSGHLCGARLKADLKRSCHNPVECPNHAPDCPEVIRCHFHRGAFGSGGGPRPKPRPMPQGKRSRQWRASDAPGGGQPQTGQGGRPGQPRSGQRVTNTASGQDSVPLQVGRVGGGGQVPQSPKPDQGGPVNVTNNVSDQARVGFQANEVNGDVSIDSKGRTRRRRLPR
jgi:hypothetical protein